jgi:hypothetical protein
MRTQNVGGRAASVICAIPSPHRFRVSRTKTTRKPTFDSAFHPKPSQSEALLSTTNQLSSPTVIADRNECPDATRAAINPHPTMKAP